MATSHTPPTQGVRQIQLPTLPSILEAGLDDAWALRPPLIGKAKAEQRGPAPRPTAHCDAAQTALDTPEASPRHSTFPTSCSAPNELPRASDEQPADPSCSSPTSYRPVNS